jgi:hypothetical protein
LCTGVAEHTEATVPRPGADAPEGPDEHLGSFFVPRTSRTDPWHTVRCIVRWSPDDVYEERLTLWQAATLEEAVLLAEGEAERYADSNGFEYTGLAQGYSMLDAPTGGVEVFSLLRRSTLEPDAYLDRFFDTGEEQQQDWLDDEQSRRRRPPSPGAASPAE